jgi:hypothetical protein
VVYKITRSDNEIYVGKTSKKRLNKRMYDHRRSKRFIGHTFSYEIVFESSSHNEILLQEKQFIQKYDSFSKGLNNSIDGSGNHNSPKFTTLGLKFSDETRKKISQKAKGNKRALGLKHKKETKEKWSDIRKGKVWSKKFDESHIRNLLITFKNAPKMQTTTSKNGRPLTHIRNFCITNAHFFNMSPKTMHNILSGKTIAWDQVYKEILDTKY